MTIREVIEKGKAQAGWSDETALELLVCALEHHDDFQAGASRPYVEELETMLEQDLDAFVEEKKAELEDDGQPNVLKEHEDFAKDGEADNQDASEEN